MSIVASSLSPNPYRGRMAPSPTGLLHLGHARTFLTAYRRAEAARGTLVLRNDDLDPHRSRPEFAAAMVEDLRWLGIAWQEGYAAANGHNSGPFGPYSQSQRHSLYRKAWELLRHGGWIYPCRCTRKDLARMGSAPHGDDDEAIYPGTCRPGTCRPQPGSSKTGLDADAAGWRFRVPDGETISFMDGSLGRQSFVAGQDLGDFLVWRRDQVPAYQLATVVDDVAMKITEVVRGADLLKSTARQILLNRALGYADPAWFHCQLVRNDLGQRLAKRHDALSLRSLREQGSNPETLLQAFEQ